MVISEAPSPPPSAFPPRPVEKASPPPLTSPVPWHARTVGDVLGARGAAPLASLLRGVLGGAALGAGFHGLRALTGGLSAAAFPREALTSALRLSSMLGGYALVRSLFREATSSEALGCMAGGAATIIGATFSSPARVETQRGQIAVMMRSLGSTAPVPTYYVALTCASSGACVVGGLDFLLARATGTRW
jgi:hypothetical protein